MADMIVIISLLCLSCSPFSQIAVLGDNHIWMHEGTEQLMPVDAIYWHQSYDYRTLDYDIMLMKLAHPATVNQYVKPVALPKACPAPGDMCTVSGWGNIYTDQGEVASIIYFLTATTFLKPFQKKYKTYLIW